MPDKVKLYVQELQHSVQVAALNFDVWWVYKSKDTRPQYVETMNRYGLFFQTSIHAHFVALLVALYRIYETREDTYNIPSLIKTIKKNASLSTSALSAIQSIYDEARPLWKKVSILRNKAFGHRSKAHTVDEVFAEAGVSADELKRLVALTKDLLNEITHALYDSMHAFNLDATHATLRMLSDLKNLRDEKKSANRTFERDACRSTRSSM